MQLVRAPCSQHPDVIKPQLLWEMVQSHEVGSGLLSDLTSFTNIFLEGKCNPKYQSILSGERLISLKLSYSEMQYAKIQPIIVFHGRHFGRHLGIYKRIRVKLLQLMCAVITHNSVKKRSLYINKWLSYSNL